jgi:hypothetical protein
MVQGALCRSFIMNNLHHKIESVQQPSVEQVKKILTMKLVVRSEYWGRSLQGRVQQEQQNPQNPYRVITCQAVLRKPGKYWGCCAHHGSRVLELNESHFMEENAGDWELYHVRSLPVENNVYHELFLVPHDQTCIDTTDKLHRHQWTFMGNVSAGMARMDLEPLLTSLLQPNDTLGYLCHHVHIQVMMDHALDREMDDKMKRKARINRKRTKNKYLETDPAPPPPMIAHVVSNDASFATTADFSQSSNNTIPSAHNEYGGDVGPPPPIPSFPHFVHGEAVYPLHAMTNYPHLWNAGGMPNNNNDNGYYSAMGCSSSPNSNNYPMGPAQQFCIMTSQQHGWQGGGGVSFDNTNTFGSFDGWEPPPPPSFSGVDMSNRYYSMMGSG